MSESHECGKAVTEMVLRADPGLAAQRQFNLFLAHAPDVPDWFEHDREPMPVAPKPPSAEEVGEDGYRYCVSWFNDPGWDIDDEDRWGPEGGLPQAVARFAAEAKSYWDAKAAREQRNHMARLVQWRYAYARAMLEQGAGT